MSVSFFSWQLGALVYLSKDSHNITQANNISLHITTSPNETGKNWVHIQDGLASGVIYTVCMLFNQMTTLWSLQDCKKKSKRKICASVVLNSFSVEFILWHCRCALRGVHSRQLPWQPIQCLERCRQSAHTKHTAFAENKRKWGWCFYN